MTNSQFAALIAMGSFHGLNPGMGWLFAVAIGLQEHSRRALFRALGPIAAGHAAAIGIVAIVITLVDSTLASRVVGIGGGVLLVAFGSWRWSSKRHMRWVGMRLSRLQLAYWSFLMSSIDGAGLMLVPVLLPGRGGGMGNMVGMAAPSGSSGPAAAIAQAAVVTVVHTAAMITVAGVIAVVVYEIVGLRLLRTAWINLDRLWAVALVGSGVATVLLT